ncbi:MAG: hypothetical protein MJK04_32770 [Psychrosphaera sp.]|nr:hypothetical protein [Psychrosphaera sp.]
MKFVKLAIVVLGLSLFTLVMSWFLVLNVFAYFIDDAPYVVGNGFYIADIIFTFLFYSLASFLVIKITKLPPFIAALPVGLTGLAMYYVELGGLSCLGVCGAPLWYDVSSFFKHLPASILVSLIVYYQQRHQTEQQRNQTEQQRHQIEPAKSSLQIPSRKYQTPLLIFTLSTICIMVWGGFVFSKSFDEHRKVIVY